jgi:hypothetical protein
MTDTEQKDWTVVFAGPADVTAENVDVNLSRWLPEHVAAVVLPNKIPRTSKGLKVVDKWLSHDDNFTPEGVDRIDDLADFLRNPDSLELADTELYLVVLWGEEGDEETEALVRLASDLGIATKDLTAGMDDVLFEEAQPDPEPEPEVTAPRRTRRTRGATPDNIVPPKEEPKETPPGVPSPPTRRRGKPRADNVTGPELPVDNDPKPPFVVDPGEQVAKATQAGIDAAAAVKSAVVNSMEFTDEQLAIIDARFAQLFADLAGTLVKHSPGRPRRDGTPAQPRTDTPQVALIALSDGTYIRRGKGRPDPTLTTIYVNPEDVQEYLESPGLR